MDLRRHPILVTPLPYGKTLPGAVYLARPSEENVPPGLWATVRRAEVAAKPDPCWNLLKVGIPVQVRAAAPQVLREGDPLQTVTRFAFRWVIVGAIF